MEANDSMMKLPEKVKFKTTIWRKVLQKEPSTLYNILPEAVLKWKTVFHM